MYFGINGAKYKMMSNLPSLCDTQSMWADGKHAIISFTCTKPGILNKHPCSDVNHVIMFWLWGTISVLHVLERIASPPPSPYTRNIQFIPFSQNRKFQVLCILYYKIHCTATTWKTLQINRDRNLFIPAYPQCQECVLSSLINAHKPFLYCSMWL